jgi:hypothetical protein
VSTRKAGKEKCGALEAFHLPTIRLYRFRRDIPGETRPDTCDFALIELIATDDGCHLLPAFRLLRHVLQIVTKWEWATHIEPVRNSVEASFH